MGGDSIGREGIWVGDIEGFKQYLMVKI